MRTVARALAGLTVMGLLTPTPASTQSVADIVEQMYEAYERHAEGVDDYTLVQRVMNFETTAYFEKEVVDGRPVFKLRQTGSEGMSFSLGDDDVGEGDIFLIGPDLIEHGRYAGREEIDGNAVHVLAVDDMSQIDMTPRTGPDGMDFEPKGGRFYVDTELLAPRRMEFDGQARTDTGMHDVTMRMDMMDYREVEGMLFAHRMVMEVDGFQAMLDPDMAAQLAEMEEQLASMPESQRAMMERMMGDQMERIRAMAGGDGPMTVEVQVTEVRVNAGPPSG